MMTRNFLIVAFILLVLSSCTPQKLYYWGHYDQATYNHNKRQTEATREDLIQVYEDIIKKKNKGTRRQVPPGIYADYGYLLILNGKIDEGILLLEKELDLYPESKKVVEYILKKI